MTQPLSQCGLCKHQLGNDAKGINIICPAFPNGIPDDVYYNFFDHRSKHPEQTGDTVYEPFDSEMDFWKFEDEEEELL